MDLIIIVVGAGILAFVLFFFLETKKNDSLNENKTTKDEITTKHKKEKSNKSDKKVKNIQKKGPIDYDLYFMTFRERLFYIIIATIVIFIVGYIFYRNFVISTVLTPFALFYPGIRRKEIIQKRKRNLNVQFKEALFALSSSLSAGKSVELAFKDALKDLRILFPDKNTHIIKEFEYIIRKVEMNETVEDALSDLAERSHLEDVENFVEVFTTCKRTGGNIVEIIRNTSNVIGDKIQIKQEIDVMISSKKFEQKVLNAMPIGMILFLSWSAADYMELVFTTGQGKIAMTVTIIFLVIAYFWSRKITNIEV